LNLERSKRTTKLSKPYTQKGILKMMKNKLRTLAAACLLTPLMPALADSTTATDEIVKKVTDKLGIELSGYARFGFYPKSKTSPAGGYSLGGNLQFYRLGNEGDNYVEIGIGKKWDMGDGVKVGAYYMPNNYNGVMGTAQAYMDISGLDFLPQASFWAGQRYHRIQDVHIVDHFLMRDGDNYGAGVDGIPVGSGKLNIAAYTQGSLGNSNANSNNAKRINLQLRDLQVNAGGKLTLTAGVIGGNFALGSKGSALGLLHNQSDFFIPGLSNSFFLQASSGHSSIAGDFYNLDNAGVALPGAKQFRIADSINWQSGNFGGQALIGYQTLAPDAGPKIKDTSLGGRVSYGVSKHVKLLGEVAITSRSIQGAAKQSLNKQTAAIAFSPKDDFWTRPEFRIYATRANWNAAASTANAASFAAGGKKSANTFGVQLEAWW
jgi:maltoporin